MNHTISAINHHEESHLVCHSSNFHTPNISDNVVSAAKDEVPDPVLDVDKNELKTGNRYYVLSVFRPGGGVSVYPTVNKNCTFAIAVTQLVFGDGIQVTFANGGTDLGEVVRESTDIVITFSPRMFFFPAVWKVDEYDEAAKQYFVTAGDFDGNQTSINNWFQIRKDTSSAEEYRFVFSPQGLRILRAAPMLVFTLITMESGA